MQTDAAHLAKLEYGTRAFWEAALAAKAAQPDSFGRECIVVGDGAAGPIRCTRAYCEGQLAQLGRRAA